jgi:hypothetical protein
MSSSPVLDSCTVWDNDGIGSSSIIRCEAVSEPEIRHTIIAFNDLGEAISSDGTGNALLSCCDVYGNAGGPGDAGSQLGVSGNFSLDPMFCELSPVFLDLRPCSPCLDAPDCGLVGAYGLGNCTHTWQVPGDAPTIQAGIDSAACGDTVLVAPGTYTGPGNRDIDFQGKAIVVTSDSLLPDIPVVDCQELGRGFHFHSGETSEALLERMFIVNGLADLGAGVLCEDASPTIKGCVLVACSSLAAGGGAYCIGPAAPIFIDCVLAGNASDLSGGGAYITQGSPVFIDCYFGANSAALMGAGMTCYNNASPELHGCLIRDGSAGTGAGILCQDSSSPTLTLCTVVNNSAVDGAGIYCFNSCSPVIDSCTFSYNRASGVGGCIGFESNSSALVTNSILAFSLDGEAVYSDGSGTATLQCCDIFGNQDGPGDAGSQIGFSGNFALDPMLCGVYAGRYPLRYCSPCLDASGCGRIGASGLGECGRTWEVPGNAVTIQAGIDSSACGDTVLVAAGTYPEHDITMKSGIVLMSETGEPDCVTIDADSLGRVMYCEGMTDTTLIKGFTLTRGYAAGTLMAARGGGMLIDHTTTTLDVEDCVITGNAADSAGGGVYLEGAGVTFDRCVISDNVSHFEGGGMCSYFGGSVWSRCVISRNQADQRGGGIAVGTLSGPDFHNCTVFGNSAPVGGGLYSDGGWYPELHNTIVAFGVNGEAVADPAGMLAAYCCDIYGNAGGPGDAAAWIGINGNFAADPAFCDTALNDFTIDESSPCVDTLSCGLVGADSIGCGESGVEEKVNPAVPTLMLGPATPNPFSPGTEIGYGIPGGGEPMRVVITVYDALGRKVRSLVDAEQPPGTYKVGWDGRDESGAQASSGVYFCRLSWNGRTETRRMVLIH